MGFGSADIGSDRSPVAGRLVSYRAPLAGQLRVVRSFQPPPQKYQAGHLGVDLASPLGSSVLAAGNGVVRFAGQVAGRGVLVIAHPDGLSTEYEPITAAVAAGDQVRAGQAIGLIAGLHRGCLPTGCLHWGARRGSDYLDPLQLLQPAGVVRLLPWNYRWPGSSPGMSLIETASQPVHRHVGIDLSGRQAGVPEQFLHRSQVGSAIEQVSSGGMAQAMRG